MTGGVLSLQRGYGCAMSRVSLLVCLGVVGVYGLGFKPFVMEGLFVCLGLGGAPIKIPHSDT